MGRFSINPFDNRLDMTDRTTLSGILTVEDSQTIQEVIDSCDTAVGNLKDGFTNPYVVKVPPGHEKEYYSIVRNISDDASDKRNVKVIFEDNSDGMFQVDLFDDCEVTTNWTGLGTTTLVLDTTKNFEGTNCFKLTRSTTGDPGVQKEITPIDVRKYQGILMDVEFNTAEITALKFLCYDNNMEFATSNLDYTLFTGKIRTTVFIPFNFPTTFTTFDFSIVKIIRPFFVRKTGYTGTCTAYLDNIRFVRTTPYRTAVIRFDDGLDEHFSIASKAMTAKGWKASFCVTAPEKWGIEAQVLTPEQIKSMDQIGHNIINHSLTGSSYVDMPRAESHQSIICMRKALEHNGITTALQLHMSPGYTGNEYILNYLKQQGMITMDGKYNIYPTYTVSTSDTDFTISAELQNIIDSGIGGIIQIVIHTITNETNFNTRMDWIEENFSEVWLATDVINKLPSKYKPKLIEGRDIGYSKTLSGDFNLYVWHGQEIILDPGGSARDVVPTGEFDPYREVTIINTADAAETLTFDPTFNAAGAHDGDANTGILTDSGESWTIGQLVGRTITNTTDSGTGVITANDGTTVTASLTGGTDNDWDIGDTYTITPVGLNQAIVQNERGMFVYDGSGWIKTNYTGDVTPYWSSVEPFLDENSANVANKPTLVTRGMFKGYSLPEYATGEELSFRMRVPFRWDGSTNPWFVAITSISVAEDVDTKYRFQLEWTSEDVEDVIPDTVQETLTYEVTVADGTAFYAEIIAFELDSTTIVSGQNLQARLRRIAATSSSVSNEIIVWHWCTRWRMNKLGTESIQGY